MRRDRRVFIVLAVAFGPYFVFDLLFQETATSRYALPFVVPVAYLAAAGAGCCRESRASYWWRCWRLSPPIPPGPRWPPTP